jgi:DNA modification methylase
MHPSFDNGIVRLYQADARALPFEDASVDCVVTSPPYWGLRDYGNGAEGIGLEPTLDEYIANLVAVFREVHRVLKPHGTAWLNLGDAFAGSATGADRPPEPGHTRESDGRVKTGREGKHQRPASGLKPKDLIGLPWRVAFALQADGWWLRSDIIWHKPNPMPESITDRPTSSHEHLFLLAKSERYYYDGEAIREPAKDWSVRDRSNLRGGTTDPLLKHHGLTNANNAEAGRNKRNVWTIATTPYPGAHFATFPEALVEPCILAGCPEGGTVLDPFMGSGTVGSVAQRLGRKAVGTEMNADYIVLAAKRIGAGTPRMAL